MQSLPALQTELSGHCDALCGVHVVPAQVRAAGRATLVEGNPVSCLSGGPYDTVTASIMDRAEATIDHDI